MPGPLEEGTTFAGRYRVVRCLASGGMGAVYEVVHLGTERRRALKVMLPHLFHNDEMRERFAREARVTSQIESEYIVDVSDAGVDEATKMPFLVMELLRGEELGKRLKRVGRFSPGEAVTYLQQVGIALDRTHAASIVHRDLKPANLFLTQREDGTERVKILDFGVAKVVAESSTGAGATQSLGTPLYMPPEQFRTGTKLTPAADIYALGLVAYTLLVGEAYWAPDLKQAGDVIAFVLVALNGPVDSAVKRAAARDVVLPERFDAWFFKVTAANPADRFVKASEAVRALAEVLGVELSGRASLPSFPGVSGAATTGSLGSMEMPTVLMAPRARAAPGRGALVAVAVGLIVGTVGVGVFVARWLGRENPAVTAAEATLMVPAAVTVMETATVMATATATVSATAMATATATAMVTATAPATTTTAKVAASSAPIRPAAKITETKKSPTAAPANTLLGRD